jgi:SAM-dependent methyltransferase
VRSSEVSWSGLEALLSEVALHGARIVDGDGHYSVVDFEPWRSETFYDSSPFEFSVDASEWQASPPLIEMLTDATGKRRRLEVGCGGGRNVRALLEGGADVCVVDQSIASLRRVAHTFPVRAARASALALPFVDGAFDLVVIDGVAHHTGDAERALAEAARVLKPGGVLYAALYRSSSLYETLYRTVGGVLRTMDWARRLRGGALAGAVDWAAFALYRLASRIVKPGRTQDSRALRNIYDDYFLTPIATFHSEDWLRAHLGRLGLVVRAITPFKNVWAVRAERPGEAF